MCGGGAAGGSEAQEEAGLGARVLRDRGGAGQVEGGVGGSSPCLGDAVCWPLVHWWRYLPDKGSSPRGLEVTSRRLLLKDIQNMFQNLGEFWTRKLCVLNLSGGQNPQKTFWNRFQGLTPDLVKWNLCGSDWKVCFYYYKLPLMMIFRQPLPRNVWELLLDECSFGEIYDTRTIKPEERLALVDLPWHVVQTLSDHIFNRWHRWWHRSHDYKTGDYAINAI